MRRLIMWALLDTFLTILSVGLIQEVIRDGYHWIYVLLAAILIALVNVTIYLDYTSKDTITSEVKDGS